MDSIGYQFVRFFYSDTLFEQEMNMKHLILISAVILLSGLEKYTDQYIDENEFWSLIDE